jgi:hypothetical protein
MWQENKDDLANTYQIKIYRANAVDSKFQALKIRKILKRYFVLLNYNSLIEVKSSTQIGVSCYQAENVGAHLQMLAEMLLAGSNEGY